MGADKVTSLKIATAPHCQKQKFSERCLKTRRFGYTYLYNRIGNTKFMSLTPSLVLPPSSSRRSQIAERLAQLARQLGAGAQLPPMAQLRRDLGVSMTALSQGVAELEEQGVLTRRSRVGLFVAAGAREATLSRIALVCDPQFFRSGHSPFWDLLVERAQTRAAQKNERLDFHWLRPLTPRESADKAGAAALDENLKGDLEAGRIAGVFSLNAHRETAAWIENLGVPVVSFGSPSRHRIVQENDDLVKVGARALTQSGCQRIGLWQLELSEKPFDPAFALQRMRQTREVFAAQLREGGLTLHPELIHQPLWRPGQPFRAPFSYQEQGWDLAMRFFDGALPSPDGLVIVNDMMTRGALAALKRLNVEVGRDVRIATHANRDSDALGDYEDRLIRLQYDPTRIVEAMFRQLEALWNGATELTTTTLIKPQILLPNSAT